MKKTNEWIEKTWLSRCEGRFFRVKAHEFQMNNQQKMPVKIDCICVCGKMDNDTENNSDNDSFLLFISSLHRTDFIEHLIRFTCANRPDFISFVNRRNLNSMLSYLCVSWKNGQHSTWRTPLRWFNEWLLCVLSSSSSWIGSEPAEQRPFNVQFMPLMAIHRTYLL